MISILGSVFQVVSAFTADGKLAITTDKGYYVSGEMITGTIYAQIFNPISCRAIVVQCVGYEKTEWNERRTRNEQKPGTNPPEYEVHHEIHRHRGKKTFFNVTVPVYNLMNGTLMPGTYTWPFQYQLPDGIPGSFYERRELGHIEPNTRFFDDNFYGESFYDSDDELDYKGPRNGFERRYERPDLHAVVHYKLKATIDVNGMFIPNLHAKQALVVNPRLAVNLAAQTATKSTDVTVCCCIKKGTATLQCAFDKNAYTAGEVAQINADINNQSTKELRMAVKLYRTLRLQNNTGYAKVERIAVNEADYPGAPPLEHCQRNMPLPLSSPQIKPTTQGQFVSCTYEYGVVGKVSWGTDIHINLPVQIYAPQPPPGTFGVRPTW